MNDKIIFTFLSIIRWLTYFQSRSTDIMTRCDIVTIYGNYTNVNV